MGIYGALATAVSGLRAQSFALEGISGNIANSQTIGYKRVETNFVDLIPDAPAGQQLPGAVMAGSRSTNTDAGDIVSASSGTYMALNGSGFFIVEEKIAQNDGNAVFGGTNFYTRRGDFDVDKEGFLVNGAGYYLKGLPIDKATGNISGSVPEVIQISNAFLAANASTRVDYRLNLPQLPKPASYDPLTANSELMDAADFVATPPDVTATATGGTALTGANDANTVMQDGETLTIQIGNTELTFEFDDTAGTPGVGAGNIAIDVTSPIDIDTALAAIETELQNAGIPAAGDATVGLDGGGNVEITMGTDTTTSFSVTDGTAGGGGLDLADDTYDPVDSSIGVAVPNITADQHDDFVEQSIAGGAITVYAANGSPVNVQMRWAKSDSSARGGTDTWQLYYLSDSAASGNEVKWRSTGTDFQFAPDGSLSPNVESTTISGLEVNGVSLGNVTVQHGTGGVTQFADPNGTTQVTALNQNGYAAGEFVSATVNNDGRIVATYSNGQQIELAQVVTAKFNAPNSLKKLDGGMFAATSESGEAIIDTDGGVLAASLESSNTDISEEFTKLITTQQAYAAGTRIVSTSDEMLQEALNMLR